GAASCSASVTVTTGSLASIAIMTNPVTIGVGEAQQITAVGCDIYGNVITGMSFDWGTNVGSISATGVLTAQTTPGFGAVTVNFGFITTYADVTIVAGPVDHIVVMPDPASVATGGSMAFSATAYDQFNNEVFGAVFIWITNIGTVDATGYFTALTTPGAGTVTATNGTISGWVVVTVVIGELHHITVVPGVDSVNAGSSKYFVAIGFDLYDNVITGLPFLWSTDVGLIDSLGMLIAQTTMGTGYVQASVGAVNGTANVSIIAGALDHIIITPDTVTVTVGAVQAFAATAYDRYDNVVTGTTFTWTTNVGVIDVAGFFTSQTVPNTGIVTARFGMVTGSATVNVVIGAVDHIVVTPTPVTTTVGDSVQFSATAYDAFNNPIPGVTFIWTTSIGSVDGTGYFTARTTPGMGVVRAASGLIDGIASVTIVSGQVDHIAVVPNPTTVAVGQYTGFIAVAYDSYNNVISGAIFSWSSNVGTIDSSGWFVCYVPVTGTVTASIGAVAGNATVNVVVGPLDHIVLTPNPVTVLVSTTLQFNAVGYDMYGNALTGIAFTWLVSMVGTITQGGLFTAQATPGFGGVTVTSGPIGDSATVIVVDAVDHIWVSPDPASVNVGQTMQFTAVAYDAMNEEISGLAFVWTTDVGAITSGGLLTAQTTPGSGIVIASFGLVTGQASATITVGPVSNIIISPNSVTLAVATSQQFAATAYDAFNNVVVGVGFVWTTCIGTVDSTGYFTAQTVAVSGFVRAANGTIFAEATVHLVPGALANIVVSPSPVNVIVSGAMQFAATGFDTYGNPISGVAFTWSTDAGSVDSAGWFNAQAFPGAGTVTATNGTFSGFASVNVINAVIDHIAVVPGTATVTVGGTLAFNAIAYDALNNVISGVLFVWTTDIGGVDASGHFTAQMATGAGTVTATNGSLSSSSAVTIAERSFDIDLVFGWNLISTPLVPSDTSVPVVLGSISGQWDRVMWYNTTDVADHWKQYYTVWPASFNDLQSIDCTMGFWLNALANTTLTVYGTLPTNMSLSLRTGWNMVGYPKTNDSTYTVANLKFDTGATTVEGFDALSEYRTRVLEDSYVLKRGQGYWIYTASDSNWAISNSRIDDVLDRSVGPPKVPLTHAVGAPSGTATAEAASHSADNLATVGGVKAIDKNGGWELVGGISSGMLFFVALAMLILALRTSRRRVRN
ncbi:MAG: hypothetical protein V1934_04860, partial [Methanobacteriota archaeon]